MKRTFVGMLAMLLLLAGCDAVDAVKEGFKHSQAVSAELEKSLGVKSFVGFNWNNGVLTTINVNFQTLPKEHRIDEIAKDVRAAVAHEFKKAPKKITISFTVTP